MRRLAWFVLVTATVTIPIAYTSCTGRDSDPPESTGDAAAVAEVRRPPLREISPEDRAAAEEHLQTGTLRQLGGKIDSAEVEYRAALELAPGHVGTSLRYAKMLVAIDRLGEALDCLESSAIYNPDSVEVRLELADYLESYDQPDEAMKQYRAILEIDSTNVAAHYKIGRALFAAGDYEGALALFRRHSELVPESGLGPANAGAALARLGRLPEAIEQFRLAVEKEPKAYDAQMYLALALVQSGEKDEAISHFLVAFQNGRGNVEPLVQIGSVRLGRGELVEAEKMFKLVLQNAPGNMTAMVRLAESLDRQGKYQEAKEMLEKVKEADPDNPVALKRLPILERVLADSAAADSTK